MNAIESMKQQELAHLIFCRDPSALFSDQVGRNFFSVFWQLSGHPRETFFMNAYVAGPGMTISSFASKKE